MSDTEEKGYDTRQFFENSLDMLCIAGFDGYFKRVNPAWERTLGHSSQSLIDQPYVSFVHPEDVEATIKEAEKLGIGGDTICFENRYKCKDGSYKWLMWRATPDMDRELIYAAARDITDRKLAEEDETFSGIVEAVRGEIVSTVSGSSARRNSSAWSENTTPKPQVASAGFCSNSSMTAFGCRRFQR